MSGCDRPDLNERLVDALDGDDVALREHAAVCAVCGSELSSLRLVDEALDRFEVEAPLDAVLERVRQTVQGENWGVVSAAVNSVSSSPMSIFSRRVLTAAAVGFAIAIIEAVVMGAHASLIETPMAWVSLAVLSGGWVLGLAAAGGVPNTAAAFGVTAVLGLSLAAFSSGPGIELGHATCLALSIGAAVLPLVAAGLILGEARPRRALTGIMGGAAAGLLAVATVRTYCPAQGAVHALVMHGMAIPVAALMGLALVRMQPRQTSAPTTGAA